MILPKGLDTQPLGRDVLGIWRRMVSGQGVLALQRKQSAAGFWSNPSSDKHRSATSGYEVRH